MAKELLTGDKKIQQICDLLKIETLEPAKKEAAEIIEEAKAKAKEIVAEAESKGKEIVKKGREELEREKAVFQTSLIQGAGQCFEALKQRIQEKLFNDELHSAIHKEAVKPTLIADLIKAVVGALEKQGLEADLEAVIAKTADPREVNRLLGDEILKKLEAKPGSIDGGAEVRVVNKKITLDMSDQALKELLSRYLRKDFRELLFKK